LLLAPASALLWPCLHAHNGVRPADSEETLLGLLNDLNLCLFGGFQSQLGESALNGNLDCASFDFDPLH
jgi:hypothetical protein